jgi:hypothetical protein
MSCSTQQLTRSRTVQIWAGAVAVVVLMVLVSGHLMTLRDRTLVAAAVRGADQFRLALAAYELDYGTFPADSLDCSDALLDELRDPAGRAYIRGGDSLEFITFSYTPDEDGQGYTIVIHARDRRSTPIEANPYKTMVRAS